MRCSMLIFIYVRPKNSGLEQQVQCWKTLTNLTTRVASFVAMELWGTKYTYCAYMWADNEGHLPQIKTQCSESNSRRPLSGWNKSAARLLQRENLSGAPRKKILVVSRGATIFITVETTRTEGICTKIGRRFKVVGSQKDPLKPPGGVLLLHKAKPPRLCIYFIQSRGQPLSEKAGTCRQRQKGRTWNPDKQPWGKKYRKTRTRDIWLENVERMRGWLLLNDAEGQSQKRTASSRLRF